MFLDKQQGLCHKIDIAAPGDARIKKKEKEKMEKYQDERREVAWLWRVNVSVTHVVVGALGMVTKNLQRIAMRVLSNAVAIYSKLGLQNKNSLCSQILCGV